MDFKNILTQLDQLNEGVEVVTEKAESKNQATAARIALKHKKEGTKPKAGTASAEMMKMSKSDLEDFTKAKKGAPKKKTKESVDRSFDTDAFRKNFEAMVEAKAKPDYIDLDKDGDKKEPMKKAAKDAKKKKGQDVEEGKSPHKKGSKAYKKQMAAKHASMAESINESFEKFIGNEKMSFEEMVAVVQESGGQQKIDPVDNVLWQWANRVASSKGEGEMFAAEIYESNGGRFELHDVLSESTGKKPENA